MIRRKTTLLERLRSGLPVALLFGIAACGPPQESTGAAPDTRESLYRAPIEAQPEPPRNRVGQGLGRVVAVTGDALIIEHGPLSGLEMAAMTMRFETVNAVVAAEFAPGDGVAFRVKQGRDRVYRIMAICRTDTGGATCLDEPAAP